MRLALALFIFCAACLQCLLKPGIVAYYEYNKAYIAKNLCENRDKPQLKCCGKCYLRRQLAKADGTQNPKIPPASATEKMELLPFIVPEVWHPARVYSSLAKFHTHYCMPLADEPHAAIFQPPG